MCTNCERNVLNFCILNSFIISHTQTHTSKTWISYFFVFPATTNQRHKEILDGSSNTATQQYNTHIHILLSIVFVVIHWHRDNIFMYNSIKRMLYISYWKKNWKRERKKSVQAVSSDSHIAALTIRFFCYCCYTLLCLQ